MDRKDIMLLCGMELLGNVRKRALIDIYRDGHVEDIDTEELLCTGLIKGDMAREIERFRNKSFADSFIQKTVDGNIDFLCYTDPCFPEKLMDIDDWPIGMFYRGRLPREDAVSVAIIGSRKCSVYGEVMAKNMGEGLARAGTQIISGMARGIDAYGMEGGLKAGGEVYAILGCGIDICYPKENYIIYEEILQKGGILSEFPPGSEPVSWHFPYRNRLISGFAKAVYVVEAAEKSGTMVTVQWALDQGRDVFVLPGRVTDKNCEGTSKLLYEGARPAWKPEHILSEYGTEFDDFLYNREKLILDNRENVLYSCLCYSPKGVEELRKESGLSFGELQKAFMGLKSKGLAEEAGAQHFYKSK